jgi:Ca2+-binding RTX toxin-like protein
VGALVESGLRRLGFAALLAVSAAAVGLVGQAKAVSCSRSAATVTVALGAGQNATIVRSGDSLNVNPGGCSGNPTVNNTDRINVTGAAGAETITIDFSGGLFRPGATNEAQGDSEIEIDLAMGAGEDSLIVNGRAENDSFVSGTAGINYDADNDVDITRQSVRNVTLDGADGNDVVSGGGGAGTGEPQEFAITLQGGAGDDALSGGRGNDTLSGGVGIDDEHAGDGDDTFNEGAEPNGADSLDGGAGTDEVNYENRTVSIAVSLDDVADDGAAGEGDNAQSSIERARTGTAPDTLTGNASNNRLNGGDGIDTLNGLDGDDTLVGEGGADVHNGGNGTDTASYAGRTAPVTVTIDGVANDGESGEGDNVGTDIEEVSGGSAADRLTGGDANNTLRGNDGDDILAGAGGSDNLFGGNGVDTATYEERSEPVSVTLDGDPNDGEGGEGDNVAADVENVVGGTAGDSLTGNGFNNVLDGGAGADRLSGGDGNDIENGGDGNDRFIEGAAANGADQMNGGPGTDAVAYGSRVDNLAVSLDGAPNDGALNEGDDVGAGVEKATTGSGDDNLDGSASRNNLSGGRGKDSIAGGGSADDLSGGKGSDNIGAGDGEDDVSGGQSDDKLRGKAGADNVSGGSGADRLEGGAAGDDHKGKNGNDKLLGGAGNDSLNGGDGRDDCATGPDGGSKKNCER